ncbi:MAG: hypothetical protein CVU74_08935 [Deltaproteobacteria bacterium HGW-Deltaproteobacteria-9]|nr:MAG: hypothetical protein CVU74_08935 [Deltaproteobacteria bacterium HGW-Deltaproteobacteria-9]
MISSSFSTLRPMVLLRTNAIMMVTTKADKDTIISCIKLGADDYIVKPFDGEKILQKIKKYINI